MKKYLFLFMLMGIASCRDQHMLVRSPNILLIICTDLNVSVEGFGGHPQARSPHMDRLAKQGIRFTNAHSAAPICGPSRASMLTGIYPHHSGLYGYNQNQNAWHQNLVLQHCKPIFEHFADNGYKIMAAGKLFHNNHHTQVLFKRSDGNGEFGPGMEYGPFAWTGNVSENIYNDLVAHPDIPRTFGSSGFTSFASYDHVPAVLPDELTAEFIIDKLQEEHEAPFFLTAGIIRPHSPWHAPKEFFDLYPLDQVKLPPYKKNDLEDCAEELWYQPGWGKVHRFQNLLECYEGDEVWSRFLQANLACVSFADHQIGRILFSYIRWSLKLPVTIKSCRY